MYCMRFGNQQEKNRLTYWLQSISIRARAICNTHTFCYWRQKSLAEMFIRMTHTVRIAYIVDGAAFIR